MSRNRLTAFSGMLLAFGLFAGQANADLIDGQSLGIDFGSNPATPNGDGAGQEAGFLLVGDSGAFADAVGTGVDVTVSGLPFGGTAGDPNQGFATAGVGVYTGTPFSDLSVNDSVFDNVSRANPDGDFEPLTVTLSQLTDIGFEYDVQAVFTAGPGPDSGAANNTNVYVHSDGTFSQGNIADILGTGPSNQLTPLELNGLTTDGAGNLVLDFGALNEGATLSQALIDSLAAGNDEADLEQFFLLAAVNVTARAVAVPEPSSLAMLGMGALGLVARRRRR